MTTNPSTPPQPPSQTLRERIWTVDEAEACKSVKELRSDLIRSIGRGQGPTFLAQKIDHLIRCSALAAQEASPQPDLAREWFEKGFQAGLSAVDRYGEQCDTAEEAYDAATRDKSAR